jgi:hypothetical protein
MKQTVLQMRTSGETHTMYLDETISRFPHLPLQKLVHSFGGIKLTGSTVDEPVKGR